MPTPRKDIVLEGQEGVYHCVSRCVRRAFLCGVDPLTDTSYEHRKDWIRERLIFLAKHFAVDVFAYAVMSNHTHLVLRTRPDLAEKWDARKVARCWFWLFPIRKGADGKPCKPSEAEVDALSSNKKKIKELRQRLCSVSWLMRCLNEWVARKANKEDGCTGRFWQGRFKCQRLLDEGSVLACMAYVDLNPVRAGIHETPELSEFTSAYDRIIAKQAKAKLKRVKEKFAVTKGTEKQKLFKRQQKLVQKESSLRYQDDWLSSVPSAISISQKDYLEILDWTGRKIRKDKTGAIPEHLLPIMQRMQIDLKHWTEMVNNYGRLFHRLVGKMESLRELAESTGQNWFQGVKPSAKLFKQSSA